MSELSEQPNTSADRVKKALADIFPFQRGEKKRVLQKHGNHKYTVISFVRSPCIVSFSPKLYPTFSFVDVSLRIVTTAKHSIDRLRSTLANIFFFFYNLGALFSSFVDCEPGLTVVSP